jgi:hypothetical protein
MVKNAKNGGIVMIYHGQETEVLLPNLDLGLYAMNSLIVLPPRADVARSASTRIEQAPPTHYYGADTTPQGPAYTGYEDFSQAGLS